MKEGGSSSSSTSSGGRFLLLLHLLRFFCCRLKKMINIHEFALDAAESLNSLTRSLSAAGGSSWRRPGWRCGWRFLLDWLSSLLSCRPPGLWLLPPLPRVGAAPGLPHPARGRGPGPDVRGLQGPRPLRGHQQHHAGHAEGQLSRRSSRRFRTCMLIAAPLLPLAAAEVTANGARWLASWLANWLASWLAG